MAKRYDETSLGGPKRAFETTHWSVILQAHTLDERRRQAAAGELVARYWKPVYCYLRRKGYGNEAAKDLAQGFFGEVVLGRGLIEQADPAKGRFRTFLLTALDRYAVSAHRAEAAQKWAPSAPLARLDGEEPLDVPAPVSDASPDRALNYAWAAELLDRVLAETERECRERGKASHWEVFAGRVLRPIMDSAEPPPLAALCAKLGVRNEATAANMIVTVKRRFQAVLKRCVLDGVGCESEADEEIRELLRILSGGGAGP